MSVKSLRQKSNWSQEQLAQLSGLNVRTIQRIEKGERVGLETLKSLAAVFEITVDDLKGVIENKLSPVEDNSKAEVQERQKQAKEKVQSLKGFYMISFMLTVMFLFFGLPNYNQGENLGPLIVMALSYISIILAYAFVAFKPFGDEWEKKKVQQILDKQDD